MAGADGYVVQTLFGFCEKLAAARPGRPCRYMTLLRDPIERLVSEWNYFCLDCAEGGRMCANSSLTRTFEASMAPLLRSAAVPKNTCPSMSLRDYALLSGNRYTVMFSRRAHETAPVTALTSIFVAGSFCGIC